MLGRPPQVECAMTAHIAVTPTPGSVSVSCITLRAPQVKTSRIPLLAGATLIVVAESACASLSFDVVGDILVDRSTGYGWRQHVQTGFPSSTVLGDGWYFASLSAINEMLPGLGTYAATSDVARAMAFFDPLARGYVGGWFTHGTNAQGLPVFDGSNHDYSLGSEGTITTQGWGVSTVGDYAANHCLPPYPAPLFEPFCNTPREFFIFNPSLPNPVPLPASWFLLCGGLAVGRWLANRKPAATA